MTRGVPSFPYRHQLALPVIGLEAEFKVFVDGVEVAPEDHWQIPAAIVGDSLLARSRKSLQLPTGGALYFDGGVIEVVTPVIEIEPQCTGRVVRSLWEQIGYVRDALDRWETRSGEQVRLQGFSCHFNVSFELPREERSRSRNIQKLAVLLAHLLPAPVIVSGANRRSTGVGVRPRRERIEVTVDFTPDPGLMAAATAAVVGIVRGVIGWPSYRLADAEARGVPLLAELHPGKHPTRKGWIARAEHFAQNPFAADLDARGWTMRDGRTLSLREVAHETALAFKDAIRESADPFSDRLLFAVLRGELPSLLDLERRPAAYDDVGRTARWGESLPELGNFSALMTDGSSTRSRQRRRIDLDEKLAPPWRGEPSDRRAGPRRATKERRASRPAPSRRLTRSRYERVFLNLGARRPLRANGELLTPIGVKGWYHALFRNARGEERLISIDQLRDADWQIDS